MIAYSESSRASAAVRTVRMETVNEKGAKGQSTMGQEKEFLRRGLVREYGRAHARKF